MSLYISLVKIFELILKLKGIVVLVNYRYDVMIFK